MDSKERGPRARKAGWLGARALVQFTEALSHGQQRACDGGDVGALRGGGAATGGIDACLIEALSKPPLRVCGGEAGSPAVITLSRMLP